MKHSFLFTVILSVVFASCSKLPENQPSTERSIETAGTETGEKVLIRLKPKLGDSQKMLITMNMNSEEEDEMSVGMISKLDMSVIERDGESFTYQMDYKSVKMNMQLGVMEMNYDSETDSGNGASVLGSQIKGLLENPVIMKMDEMGNVLEFKLPGNFTSEQTGDLGSVTVPLPKEAVGTRDSWTAERDMEGMGKMYMNLKIDKITIDDVVISLSGSIKSVRGEEIGEFSGNYRLDRDTGFTKDGLMNMNLTELKKTNIKIEFKSY